MNTRTAKITAKNGGKQCTGPSTMPEKCNDKECPKLGKDNIFIS